MRESLSRNLDVVLRRCLRLFTCLKCALNRRHNHRLHPKSAKNGGLRRRFDEKARIRIKTTEHMLVHSSSSATWQVQVRDPRNPRYNAMRLAAGEFIIQSSWATNAQGGCSFDGSKNAEDIFGRLSLARVLHFAASALPGSPSELTTTGLGFVCSGLWRRSPLGFGWLAARCPVRRASSPTAPPSNGTNSPGGHRWTPKSRSDDNS